ncbi:MAG: modA [Acidobacteriales bacterium]|nr:modA [Terriglobales bacterium]
MIFSTSVLAQSELTIAAASDLSAAMKELVAGFEKQSGTKVKTTFGSSGNFYAQIQNGAPFDIFFSADVEYPRKLESAGLAEAGTLYEYARGQIVLWVRNDSPLDITTLQMVALLDSTVRKIAIANPSHAPYGRAAVAALRHFGLSNKVRDKFVIGENISQTAQFVETGNAQVGIIALSLGLSPALKDKGKYWEVPLDAYPPLEQAAVVIKSSNNKAAANAFFAYVRSPAGQEILQRYGFLIPLAKAATK